MGFDDVTKLKEKFGLTATELGIKEEFMFSYKTKGKFYDYDCDCYLNFDGNNIFTSYDLYIYGDKNGSIYNVLNDMYSGPISSNVTPYVQVNGGAVYSYLYEDKDALIMISKAQNHEYYRMNIKPNPNPGYFGTLTLKPAKLKGFFPKDVDVNPIEYNNGVLTIRIHNLSNSPFNISDDFTLFERKESSYYSKAKILLFFQHPNAYTVMQEETKDIKLDLRGFGKITPNEYIIKFSNIELYFVLDDDSLSKNEEL